MARWLRGGSYYGDWRQLHAGLLARLTRSADRAVLSDLLAAGLRQRVPAWPESGVILRLDDREWATYRALRDAGADLPTARAGRAPDGIGVCVDCRGVFRPARRGWADRCPRCHSTPRPEARREPYRTSVAIDVLDAAGEPSGWELRHHFLCAGCGAHLDAHRGDHRYCSTKCRVRAHRARRRA